MSSNEEREHELPEHVRENRAFWDAMAHEWVEAGERNWAAHRMPTGFVSSARPASR
ncbi:MAG: hypothetical protein ACOC1U_07385 [Spirochaetota bacterium]